MIGDLLKGLFIQVLSKCHPPIPRCARLLKFAVIFWCWSMTFVVVQLVPEDSDPEVADESPSKLAAREAITMSN